MIDLPYEKSLKAIWEILDLFWTGAIILPVEKILDHVTEKVRGKDNSYVKKAFSDFADKGTWPVVVAVLALLLFAVFLAYDKDVHFKFYKEAIVVFSLLAIMLWAMWLWLMISVDMAVTAILCPVGSFCFVLGVAITIAAVTYEHHFFVYRHINVGIHAEIWKRAAEALLFIFLLDVANTWRKGDIAAQNVMKEVKKGTTAHA